MRADSIPFETLLKVAQDRVAKEPNSAENHYFLGRVYSYGYAQEGGEIQVYNSDKAPSFPTYSTVQVERDLTKPLSTQAKSWLKSSLVHYHKAAQMDSKSAIYSLGYAWMLEQLATRFKEIGGTDGVGAFKTEKDAWAKTVAEYRRAYFIAKDGDKNSEGGLKVPDQYVSREAAECLLRLKKAGKARVLDPEAKALQTQINKLNEKPVAVTPIVFETKPTNTRPTVVDAFQSTDERLASMIDFKASVKFDLDGTGTKQIRNWVKPTMAFLVWDPKRTGVIVSGRQLFGNATFWMMFNDGFRALASLDVSGNGELSGPELRGIRVWQDINSNGISDPGEVKDLSDHGITGISTLATGNLRGMPWNPAGLTRSDGTKAGLLDWIAR